MKYVYPSKYKKIEFIDPTENLFGFIIKGEKMAEKNMNNSVMEDDRKAVEKRPKRKDLSDSNI